MLSLILAVAYTFTATATGVEKGSPVEFIFAGRNTEHDYETMFLLEESVDDFCRGLEKAGFPRGKPTDQNTCRLWPTGCRLTFDPPLDKYIDGKMPEGFVDSDPIYTGGTRLLDGTCAATTKMPGAVFSIYSLAQAPIVYNGIYDQGSVYGSFTAKEKIEKGTQVKFTVTCDSKTMPQSVHLTVNPGNGIEIIKKLKELSENGEVDALISFSANLTIEEATAIANALATIDSSRIKINGADGIFYRSFLPMVKWQDRQERLVQPFELMLGKTNQLFFIAEDWSVEGLDPKLTPKQISYDATKEYPKTDTCFIYLDKTNKVSRILSEMKKFNESKVRNWYVFSVPSS